MITADRRIRGLSLVEVTVAIALGMVVVVAALALLGLVSRSELAVRSRADAADTAVTAQSQLARDLAALQYAPGSAEIEVNEVTSTAGPHAGGRLSFTVLTPAGALALAVWTFDPATGDLTRELGGGPTRTFALGSGALVRFARVDPGYAHGQRQTLGAFHNRLVYRLSVPSMSGPGLTLMGAQVLSVKVSQDTFPFFNEGV